MRSSRILPWLVLSLGTVAWLVWRNAPPAGAPRPAQAAPPAAGVAAPSAIATSGAGDAADAVTKVAQRGDLLARHAYAQAWADAAQPEAMGKFRAWTDRYRAAPAAERPALVAEGVALARTRRVTMLDLIRTDPQRALAVTVSAAVRRELPAEVGAELEQRVAGRGEFALQAAQPAPGEGGGPALRRIVYLGGVTYTARPYGRRESQVTKEGASLHGLALDGEFALHESPVRLVEPGEIPDALAEPAAVCLGCGLAVEPLAAGPAALEWVEFDGAIRPVHETDFAALVRRAVAAEDGTGPRVALLTQTIGTEPTTPARAAEAATPHAIGPKQVLVIRVDFSDFPGEPITAVAAQAVLDGSVKPFFENGSYGLTTLTTTVSSQVYRLPRTGASYATANDNGGLHTDARTAAAADHAVTTFDRVIVVFPNLSASRVPGSRITYAGLGSVVGTNSWINGSGSFTLGTVSHELGHNYGLLHGNLWRVNDRNPISDRGNTLEYGDPFDMMGSTSATGVTRDARHHFNMWSKNRLGWLPDEAVTTVIRSGTYRIHRFDSRLSPLNRPLALRVFRDGVRWYWIGLRQNFFSTGTPRTNGAYVVWGFNQRLQSQLLDLTTPGTAATDAALPLGTTFTDAAYGVSIRPIAAGGTEPEQWLDVEIAVPAEAPPNVVTAWGREGSTFYDTETGEDLVPAPDTNVPMDLTRVIALAAGDQHVLALRDNGTVVAWGAQAAGQITVPAGLSGIVAIAAGGHVSGVVKADGTVQLWGDATSGILTPPAGLTGVRQLAIGGGSGVRVYHAIALKTDGTIVAWGDNSRGQTTAPAGLGLVTAIAASDRLSVALRADGTVLRWGTTFAGAVAFPSGLADVVAIASSGGASHALALKRGGTVVAWGANASGQSNVPPGLNNVVALATGGAHSLALKADGTLVTWGSLTGGRGNIPRDLPRSAAVAASASASFALTGSSVHFSAQPINQTIVLGGDVTLRVTAAGVGNLSYQWRKDGVILAGATGATLTLRGLTTAQAGLYDVVVTDALGATASGAGRLTVGMAVPEVSRIANLSIRTRGGTGAQTLIVGFVIGGAGTAGTKPLLVRGVGPTLGVFGVPGVLADPKIEVYSSAAAKLFENDNWLASDAATFASVGAFPLNANSRDAALYNGALAAAGYTAQVSGGGGTTGVVLAELYDVTPPITFGAATPRLINVSARALSGTGADVLIAGFVVAGPGEKKVLIRAIGPTLTVFGVTGVLADPKLELYNSVSVKIRENDNWGGTPELSAAFAAVGAFGLDNASRDAALLASLPPGSYTAQVSGVGGATGVALVEVYDVP